MGNPKSLLIGNGLTRAETNISWGKLLESIAKEYGDFQVDDEIPFPLEFERLVNAYMRMQRSSDDEKERNINIYLELKQKVAKTFSDIHYSSEFIHGDLKSLTNVSSIMTTNYDLLLRDVFEAENCNYEAKKYLSLKCYSTDSVSFYHVHGIADKPSTICLGYEHYSDVLKNLSEKKENIRRILRKEDLLPTGPEKNKENGKELEKDKWAYKFFTDDIAIIGLGLTTVEIDLWYLLSLRASLYYCADEKEIRDNITNHIYYFDTLPQKVTEGTEDHQKEKTEWSQKERIHKLLEGMHVEVITIQIRDESMDAVTDDESTIYVKNYREAYQRSIQYAKENLGF